VKPHLLLFFAGVASIAYAQSLDELVEEALRANPEIIAAQKRYEAMRQRPAQESSLPDPMLSVGYNSTGNPLPGSGIGTDPVANAGFSISQEFPSPGKRRLRGDIAMREADAEFAQYLMVRLSVVSRLKQAYHQLHHAYEMIDIMSRDRDLMRKILRISEARYSVGKAAQQDIFKAQTQLSIMETRIERSRQELRSREVEINSLLDRPPDSRIERPVETEPAPLRAGLDELMKQVREDAPILRREQKMIERTELALNLARKEYYPDYTVSGGYYYMGSLAPMYTARVDFKLPAYFWRKQRAGVAEQAANVSAARHNYNAANQTLSFRVKDDYLMAETSYRLMNMYSTTVIPQASLALESGLASYQTGALDFLSVLMNFTTMVEYELNYHEEVLNYFLALARLEEMTGVDLTR
jgi:outer membrane protein TolC